MKKTFLQAAAVAVTAALLPIWSCSREEISQEEQTHDEWTDPYAGYPRLDEVSFSTPETKVSYEGLDSEEKLFNSNFDANDIIYVLAVDDTKQVVDQYAYKYVGKGEKWEPVDESKKAPWSGTMQYFAYWNGNGTDLLSKINENGTRVIPKTYDSSSETATNDKTVTAVSSFFNRAAIWWIANVLKVNGQNSKDNFLKQDLMTGRGINEGSRKATFTLYHTMGLACFPYVENAESDETLINTVKVLTIDPNYCWEESTQFSKIISFDENSSAEVACRPYYPGEGKWSYLWVSPKEVMSQTIITPDNTWSRTFNIGTAKFARINLKKDRIYPKDPYVLRVSDIFYSDGSLSHMGDVHISSNASVKPIGIVVSVKGTSVDQATVDAIKTSQKAYKDNVTTSSEYTEEDGSPYQIENRGYNSSTDDGFGYHALVLALYNASWLDSPENKNSSADDYTHESSRWSNTAYNALVEGVSQVTTWNQLDTDNGGYSNTQKIWQLCNAQSDSYNYSGKYPNQYPAFDMVYKYGIQVPLTNLTSSGWFLPSAGQWIAMSKELLSSKVEGVYVNTKAGVANGQISALKGVDNPSETLAAWAQDDTHGFSLLEGDKQFPTTSQGSWAIYDIPDNYILQNYLTKAGSLQDISPSNVAVVFWTSTQFNANYSITFTPGGNTCKELSLGWDHKKDTYFAGNASGGNPTIKSTFHLTRAMLAF